MTVTSSAPAPRPPAGLRPRYPVRSSRLVLRPLVEKDVDALVSYRSLPEVCRYVPFEPMDAATVRSRIRGRWSRRHLDAEDQSLVLGMELLESGQLIGDVSLRWTSALHRSGEVGYVVSPVFCGSGYATEAAHALLHLGFDQLGLHRVTARVDAENVASARVAVRLGMRQEAHLLENEWFKGRWSDELDFAILDQEWKAQHTGGCAHGYR